MEPEQQPIQSEMPIIGHEHKRTILVVIGIVLLAAIITGIVFLIVRENKLTPLEQLEQLEKNSKPVTQSPEQRKIELDNLSKTSAPVTDTREDRLKLLESMNK